MLDFCLKLKQWLPLELKTPTCTFWAEEDSIAWFMAVGLTIMLQHKQK